MHEVPRSLRSSVHSGLRSSAPMSFEGKGTLTRNFSFVKRRGMTFASVLKTVHAHVKSCVLETLHAHVKSHVPLAGEPIPTDVCSGI